MRIKLIMIVLLFAFIYNLSLSNAADNDNICLRHPIFCKIIENKERVNETIDRKYAMDLSNSIYKACRKWNIDSILYTAILAQESRYQLNAMNCVKGLNKETHEKTTVCLDFGLGQLNIRNIIRYDIDTRRLLTDMDYAIDQGAKILSRFKKKYAHKEVNYWSRYNASSQIHRRKYEELVSRFF